MEGDIIIRRPEEATVDGLKVYLNTTIVVRDGKEYPVKAKTNVENSCFFKDRSLFYLGKYNKSYFFTEKPTPAFVGAKP